MSSFSNFKINKQFWAYLFVFMWPFIYCYRFIITGENFSLTIENDFKFLYYNYKVYLLDHLSNFNLPLWSPSEASGFAFYSNPFTQTFYPLNGLLALVYKINNGYSYADHQKFAVIGLSIFAVGLLLWLRLLNINLIYAVVSVCIVSVSFKITEILRFPNAVHTIAWLPFILYGCTLALNKSKSIISCVIIFASVIMMITAGYPYYVYYSFFLIVPYLMLILYLKHKNYCFSECSFNIKKYLLGVGVSFIGAFAICYPYLIKVKQLLDQTVNRGGNSFEYSTSFEFTIFDTIGSLIFPPAAQMEGWYYFGMMTLLLVSAMYIYITINKDKFKIQFFILLAILIWYIIISYITYGKDSYLFIFLWNYFPGFSSLRVWGRMNIIFLPVMVYLLASALSIFVKILLESKSTEKDKDNRYKNFIICFVSSYAIFLIIQLFFLTSEYYNSYWLNYFKKSFEDFNENVFIINGILSFAVLIIFIVSARFIKKKYLTIIVVITIFAANIIDLFPAGSKQWSVFKSPETERTILNIDKANINSFNSERYFKYGSVSHTKNFLTGYLGDWHYERYLKFLNLNKLNQYINSGEKLPVSYKELLGLDKGKKLFCSKKIDYNSPGEFISDSKSFEASNLTAFKIIKYNGDELDLEIDIKENCYCSFIDNWDPDWKATVNGKEVIIQQLFGTFKSIKLEKGKNVISFKYSPKFFNSF
ncbi:MAG: YfhO family protein [Bacteroidota bacterium]|nr:YfhO family protein [Bacteroidota bacterium]